ncbi:MAG: tRNA (N(6)-L-threonylcarbamoyladenosine(37)-C(2))-methylthiotransferase MtaB [Pseudomonadota bacterium]
MLKSFKIITLGCKVNQYESAYLREQLAGAGWRHAGRKEMADVAIVNTCIVTQEATHQSRQAIRKAIRDNPDGVVAAIGCYAQALPEEISKIRGLALIADNCSKRQLPKILMELGTETPAERTLLSNPFEAGMPFEPLPIGQFPDRARAYLKVQDGCESFCSYCIVPFSRGPYRSLSPKKVLSSIESLAKAGHKEIVITGIHLGKYGIDLEGGFDLCRLLKMIGKEGFPMRFRLTSLEPDEINPALVELVAGEAWLCRHFHIPLQSGDNEVLQRMNRNYTVLQFKRLVEFIHWKMPLAAIGVDIMAGFPGEDLAAHRNSLSLIRDLPVSYLHVFPFSSRPGTPASNFDGKLDPSVIKERAARLRELGQKKRIEFYRNCLGKEFIVLAEKWYSKKNKMLKGTTDNYLPVVFGQPYDSEDRLFSIRTEAVSKDMVIASLL